MQLPEVKGRYTHNADLSKTNWFQVGGAAELLFKPADLEDLQHFLKNKPTEKITILGVGSNIIIRDGGIEGVVIKLGREFANIKIAQAPLSCSATANRPSGSPSLRSESAHQVIEVGAAALDVNVATYAAENEIAELEFLVGIPGTIGGAVAMNGGAYGSETANVLTHAELLDMRGNLHKFSNEELKFAYRKCGKMQEESFIVTKVWLKGLEGQREKIYAKMHEIKSAREESQPIRSRTGGSTFKNPSNAKAWELIDKAGCRGLKIGGAQVSEKHCNFFINTGNANAADLENLILEVQKRVLENSGIKLEPEIKIIGKN